MRTDTMVTVGALLVLVVHPSQSFIESVCSGVRTNDQVCERHEKGNKYNDILIQAKENNFKNNIGLTETRVVLSRYHLGTENSRIYRERSSKDSSGIRESNQQKLARISDQTRRSTSTFQNRELSSERVSQNDQSRLQNDFTRRMATRENLNVDLASTRDGDNRVREESFRLNTRRIALSRRIESRDAPTKKSDRRFDDILSRKTEPENLRRVMERLSPDFTRRDIRQDDRMSERRINENTFNREASNEGSQRFVRMNRRRETREISHTNRRNADRVTYRTERENQERVRENRNDINVARRINLIRQERRLSDLKPQSDNRREFSELNERRDIRSNRLAERQILEPLTRESVRRENERVTRIKRETRSEQIDNNRIAALTENRVNMRQFARMSEDRRQNRVESRRTRSALNDGVFNENRFEVSLRRNDRQNREHEPSVARKERNVDISRRTSENRQMDNSRFQNVRISDGSKQIDESRIGERQNRQMDDSRSRTIRMSNNARQMDERHNIAKTENRQIENSRSRSVRNSDNTRQFDERRVAEHENRQIENSRSRTVRISDNTRQIEERRLTVGENSQMENSRSRTVRISDNTRHINERRIAERENRQIENSRTRTVRISDNTRQIDERRVTERENRQMENSRSRTIRISDNTRQIDERRVAERENRKMDSRSRNVRISDNTRQIDERRVTERENIQTPNRLFRDISLTRRSHSEIRSIVNNVRANDNTRRIIEERRSLSSTDRIQDNRVREVRGVEDVRRESSRNIRLVSPTRDTRSDIREISRRSVNFEMNTRTIRGNERASENRLKIDRSNINIRNSVVDRVSNQISDDRLTRNMERLIRENKERISTDRLDMSRRLQRDIRSIEEKEVRNNVMDISSHFNRERRSRNSESSTRANRENRLQLTQIRSTEAQDARSRVNKRSSRINLVKNMRLSERRGSSVDRNADNARMESERSVVRRFSNDRNNVRSSRNERNARVDLLEAKRNNEHERVERRSRDTHEMNRRISENRLDSREIRSVRSLSTDRLLNNRFEVLERKSNDRRNDMSARRLVREDKERTSERRFATRNHESRIRETENLSRDRIMDNSLRRNNELRVAERRTNLVREKSKIEDALSSIRFKRLSEVPEYKPKDHFIMHALDGMHKSTLGDVAVEFLKTLCICTLMFQIANSYKDCKPKFGFLNFFQNLGQMEKIKVD